MYKNTIILIYLYIFTQAVISTSIKPPEYNKTRFSETTTPEIDFQFSTNIVKNEYIVTFKAYYKQEARGKFISAALRMLEVSTYYINQYILNINVINVYPFISD